jgi:DNA invertase Pin-like site-specific DNA recombinase
MRAVVYARYSTDLQREASIEDQVRICRQRIEREGWTLLGTYSDAATSGASRLRPGYQKLLEDARAGAFDVVVAEALDRLSRDQEDVAALYKQLGFRGIRILTLAEGEISELHVGLKGTMNALFLKDLAAKTHRGLEGRVREGRSGGGLCYGYDIIREHDARGEPTHGGRRVNEGEAEIVRRIFREFTNGKSPRAIARELNADRLAGPRGRRWSDTTIRGHSLRGTGILHNELYVGRLVWNRQRYVKDPHTGRRLARLNPTSAWLVTEVPVLRIVDDALWEQAQARLGSIRESPRVAKARAAEFWKHRRARHLLTGLAHCGVCGSPLAAAGKDYLTCAAARRQGTCSNKRGMRRPVLEALILDGLKDRLMAPELVKEFIAEFHREVNRLSRKREIDSGLQRRELEEVNRKLRGLIEAIAEGLRAPGLQAKLDELEHRKIALEAELAAAPPSALRLHPNVAEIYRRKVADLQAALAEPKAQAEALEILRGLIERVVLHPAEKGFEIELVGEIAAMVSLGAHDKAASPKGSTVSEAYRCSVKVVAGERNHRQLTLPPVGV